MIKLVIVESPNKCKKIQSYLGNDWVVKASMGHIRDLPQKEMGVDLESFKPVYVANTQSKKLIANLKKLSQSANEVYLATDPDREGEAIAWHLQQALFLKNPKRVTFNEITKKAVQSAVANPSSIDYNLVYAQEGRRVLDRLVGYSVSPALSNAYGQWLTAGRVQSPAVRIVVERELEIRAFTSTAYIEVFLCFENESIAWQAQWQPGDLLAVNQKHWTDAALAQRVAKIRDVEVVSVEMKKQSKRPPPPFTTSSMQQAASVMLKMSPKQCMREAQKLFEEGLITYHRTDSPNLSADGYSGVIAWLHSNNFSHDAVTICNTWKAKAGAQEGHEAIRPTVVAQVPAMVKSQLTFEQYKLYQLIWQRAVASQMKNAKFNVTRVKLKSSEQLDVQTMDGQTMDFVAKGQQMIYPGWMKLTSKDMTDDFSIGNDNNQLLPELKAQQPLVAIDGKVKNKQTKPPSRYTEASLIRKLEAEGIGRPSTYASIIDNITTRGYVTTEKRKLKAEQLGIVIYQSLVNRFQFMELGYTRDIEKQLDEVAAGKRKYFDVVSQAFNLLKSELSSLDGLHLNNDVQHPCPKCKKPLRLIQNRFWGCSGYRKEGDGCDFSAPNKNGKPGTPKPHKAKTINTRYPCACTQGYMLKRAYQNKAFWGCSRYPECKKTLPDEQGAPGVHEAALTAVTKNNRNNDKTGAGQACPDCNNGSLVRRTVKNGKNEGKFFLGCTQFPDCKHFEWVAANA